MKLSIRSWLVALILICMPFVHAFAAGSPRTVVDIDPGWKFIKKDLPDAEQIATDD
jgi:hypothetical protein